MLVAKNLDDQEYILPDDFEGVYNALVITFRRAQQTQVESWLGLLDRLAIEYSGLHTYVLAVNQYLPYTQHHFQATRPQLSGENAHRNTFMLYVDLNDFNLVFDIPTVSQTYILLLDREGRVLWRAAGGFSGAQDACGLIDALNRRIEAKRIPRQYA